MSVFSGIASTITSAVQAVGNATKQFTNEATNNVGGVLEDIGKLSGDPVLAKLGLGLQGAQERSQTIKDIEANAPKAVAVAYGAYEGGELLAGTGGTTGTGAAATTAAGGASTAAEGAGAAAAAGEAAATSGASSAAADAGAASLTSAATSTVNSEGIIAEIASVIQEVESFLKGVIDPITNTINEINNGIIQPIVGPIKTLLQESQAIHQFVTTDLHDGIQGLLKLPGDLADSLNSIDASFSRSILQLTAAQTSILNQGLSTYGPDMGLTGSKLVTGGIASGLPGDPGKWVAPPRLELGDTYDVSTLIKSAEDHIAALSTSDTWYDRIWTGLMTILSSGGLLLAQHKAIADAAATAGMRDFPETILQVGDLLKGYQRGEFTRDQVVDEMLSAGINSERADDLMVLSRVLPGVGDFLSWTTRGLMTQDECKTAIGLLGYADEDAARYLDANVTLPDSGQTLQWWQRGIITDEALAQYLTAQGYDTDTITAIKAGATLLPQLADWMRAYDRELALSENPEADDNADNPPDAYLAAAQRLGVSSADAAILWANHLQLLPPQLAVLSYFRGYINLPQYYAYMRAASFTKDMADAYLDASRPQVPYRSIPSLVKAGILNEADAQTQLKQLGFTDIQVTWILELASASTKTTASTTATAIQKDVQTTTIDLYNAGTITRDQATSALEAAGLAADAVTALLNLEDVKNTAAAHKLEIETVVAQVQAGAMDSTAAMGALAQYGLNVRELASAQTKINTAARHRVKVPDLSTLLAMLRRGILDTAATVSNITALGYSTDWANKLVALEIAEHGALPNP